jgi:murein L,D-transpeptidase YcbB/YkuD
MFNPQRVVAKRVSKLLMLSLMVPGSVFAAEVSPAVPHNVAAVSQNNNVPIVGSSAVLPKMPADTRTAPLTAGSVDWSSLNNQHLQSTKMLCGDTTSNVCFASQIEQAYAQNKFYPLWNTVALRNELTLQLQVLADSKMLPGIAQRLAEMKQLEQEGNLRGYDLLATDTYYVYRAFQNYIAQHRSVLFLSEPVNMTHSMLEYAKGDDAYPMTMAKLTMYRPTYVDFEPTIKVIQKFENLAPHHLSASNFKSVYRQGAVLPKGHEIAQVLYNLGDMSAADRDTLLAQPTITNTGIMFNSIKTFQKRHGLSIDGIVGPGTVKQLVMPYSDIARILALNTLRLSALNRNNDTRAHIWVNIPNYKLEVFDNGKKVFESKVIVGRDTRPTNLFSSAITTMVVNPYWNVPITIKQNDVIPKVKMSRNYLKAHNMQILNSWRDRTVISPSSIDWATVNPKTFPHEFQQGPGPHNSLGNVKFLMPNDYAIFLHDTPAHGLFSRNKRDLSSGCVRVERADDLANYVINYQNRSNIAPFKTMLDTKQHKVVSLSKRIDVDFVYLTAWVDQDGHLQMRSDIYGYDSPQAKPIKAKFITMKDFVKH